MSRISPATRSLAITFGVAVALGFAAVHLPRVVLRQLGESALIIDDPIYVFKRDVLEVLHLIGWTVLPLASMLLIERRWPSNQSLARVGAVLLAGALLGALVEFWFSTSDTGLRFLWLFEEVQDFVDIAIFVISDTVNIVVAGLLGVAIQRLGSSSAGDASPATDD